METGRRWRRPGRHGVRFPGSRAGLAGCQPLRRHALSSRLPGRCGGFQHAVHVLQERVVAERYASRGIHMAPDGIHGKARRQCGAYIVADGEEGDQILVALGRLAAFDP
eukprot:gene22060-26486_t